MNTSVDSANKNIVIMYVVVLVSLLTALAIGIAISNSQEGPEPKSSNAADYTYPEGKPLVAAPEGAAQEALPMGPVEIDTDLSDYDPYLLTNVYFWEEGGDNPLIKTLLVQMETDKFNELLEAEGYDLQNPPSTVFITQEAYLTTGVSETIPDYTLTTDTEVILSPRS